MFNLPLLVPAFSNIFKSKEEDVPAKSLDFHCATCGHSNVWCYYPKNCQYNKTEWQ